MKLKELHNTEDMIQESKGRMSIKEFNESITEWNLDKIFISRFRQAILFNKPEAEIPLRVITRKELRWLIHFGFNIRIDDKVGVVKL